MSELDEKYFRPSKEQLNKIVPKIKTDNSEVIYNMKNEITNLEELNIYLTNEIVELKQEIKRLNQIIIEMELSDNE